MTDDKTVAGLNNHQTGDPMSGEKQATVAVPPIVATVVGYQGLAPAGLVAPTPGAATPNVAIQFVQPIVAILVRFANTFLVVLATDVLASVATSAISGTDLWHLALKCGGLALGAAGLGLLKDLVTVFGKLETKYPLLTGSV